jgi:cytidylate kinase
MKNRDGSIEIISLEKEDYMYGLFDGAFQMSEFLNSDNNIAFITGLPDLWMYEVPHGINRAGSGVSTLAAEIKEKFRIDGGIINLDDFQNGADCECPIVLEYINNNPDLKGCFDLYWRADCSEAYGAEFLKFFYWLISRLRSDNKRYIVQGMQIMTLSPNEWMSDDDAIIVKIKDFDATHCRLVPDSSGDRFDIIFEGAEIPKGVNMEKTRDNWIRTHMDFVKHKTPINAARNMADDKHDLINESFNKIKDVPDVEYGLEEWKNKENRFLFITGISGSGKSTQAKKLAEDYDAAIVELDNELGTKFINHVGKTKLEKMNEIQYSKEVAKYVLNLHHSGQVIIEGVGLLEWFEDIPDIKHESFIIKGSSYVKSSIRGSKRDGMSPLKTVSNFFKNVKAYEYYADRCNELMKILKYGPNELIISESLNEGAVKTFIDTRIFDKDSVRRSNLIDWKATKDSFERYIGKNLDEYRFKFVKLIFDSEVRLMVPDGKAINDLISKRIMQLGMWLRSIKSTIVDFVHDSYSLVVKIKDQIHNFLYEDLIKLWDGE